MTRKWNNAQLSNRLSLITEDLNDAFQLVGQLNDREITLLENFLSEYIQEEPLSIIKSDKLPFYVKTQRGYSLCIKQTKILHKDAVTLLSLVFGLSPVHWGEEEFQIASNKLELDNSLIYMDIYGVRDDLPIRVK